MAKKVSVKKPLQTEENEVPGFLKNKWAYVIVLCLLILTAIIYFFPSLNGSSLSAHDYQQGTYNAHQLVKYHEDTGHYAKWASNIFSGMPSFQVWFSYNNLSSWISSFFLNLTNPYIFIGLLMAVCSTALFYAMGMHPIIVLIGGFSLLFSNFNIVSLFAGHNNKVMVISLVPLTLAGIWLLYERKKYLLALFVIAISTSLQVRLNHVQITYFMMLLVGIWSLFKLVEVVKQRDFKHLGLSFLILMVGLGLGIANNSTQLYSTYEYSQDTQRGGPTEVEKAKSPQTEKTGGVSYDYATAWSYGKLESFTLLIPNFSGGPEINKTIDENNPIVKVLTSQGVSEQNSMQFAEQLPIYWGNQPFVAGTTYIGAILIYLLIVGAFLLKDNRKWWLISSLIVTLFIAWGNNFSLFYKILFNYLPFFNKFRTPSMIFYLSTIITTMMATLFLNTIVNNSQHRDIYWSKFLKVSGVVIVFILIIALLGPGLFTFSAPSDADLKNQLLQVTQNNSAMTDSIMGALLQERKDLLRADSFRSLIFIVLTFGLIAAYLKRKLPASLMLGCIAFLLLIDVVGVDKRYVNYDSFKENTTAGIFEATPTEADLFILKDTDPDYRVLDLSVNTFNDGKPSYFHKNVGGYHPAKLSRYQDMISYLFNQNLDKLRNGEGAGAQVLNMLNTRYIITTPQASGVFKNTNAYGSAWLVNQVKILNGPVQVFDQLMNEDLRHTALLEKPSESIQTNTQFETDSSSQIHLTKYSNDEITYKFSSSKPAYAVFSEIYYNSGKGWTAYIDGKQAKQDQVNYLLRGLPIPAGQHDIVFKFDTPSLNVTQKIDMASSILILLLGIGVLAYQGLLIQKKRS